MNFADLPLVVKRQILLHCSFQDRLNLRNRMHSRRHISGYWYASCFLNSLQAWSVRNFMILLWKIYGSLHFCLMLIPVFKVIRCTIVGHFLTPAHHLPGWVGLAKEKLILTNEVERPTNHRDLSSILETHSTKYGCPFCTKLEIPL